MSDIRVADDLWASSMVPEGVLERWFVHDGDAIVAGDHIAEIQIEGARHEIVAPSSGRISVIAGPGALIEPGSILATMASPSATQE